MATDPSCDAVEARRRGWDALSMGGQYVLGTGDYNGPVHDVPWTVGSTGVGSDCAGFAICYAWKLRRHRPGFNRGAWASVSDDINCNSAIEDGLHKKELFETLGAFARPQYGDLLAYPTFYIHEDGDNGKMLRFIGHVGLITAVPDDYVPGEGWHRLVIAQCHGPNGFRPGVVQTDGSIWDHHDHNWPKPQHRTQLVRPHTR